MPKKKKKKKVNEISGEFPRLSVLTPLYNRNKWLPLMLSNIIHFDYPKEKIEWFILDSKDGDEDVRLIPNEFTKENIEKMIHPIKLRYEYIPRKMTIAEKRTYLSKNMSHPWFANMDSDDIYMDCFLKYGVNLCKKNKVGLCGSPQMIFVYPHLDYRVTAIQCGAARQMHEATMIGTKKYLKSMNYYTRNDEKGEGASLVDGNDMNVVKSECSLCMICVCHNTNTCNKDAFEEINVQSASITGIKRDILVDIMTKEIEEGKENNSKFTIPKPEIPDPQAEKYKTDKLKEDYAKNVPPKPDN
jgi:glycosyltransferase involved in cell wall biosynthesis